MARIKLTLPEHWAFITETEIRIGDTNYAGHMGNDALLALLHEARIRYLESMGFSEMDIEGAGLIMADSVIEYRSEAFRGETLCIGVAATEIGRRSCDLVYRITEKASGRLVAVARTGVVFFDYATRTSLPVPSEFVRRCGTGDTRAA